MKMKKFFSIVCLTVALSVHSLPVNAQIPWRVLRPFLQGLGAEVGRVMINAITAPKANTFPVYTDGEWLVTFVKDGNDLIYYGVNLETKDEIRLRGVTIQGNPQRHVFSWNNGDYRYQVAQQANETSVIRLQVFGGSKELLNRLLYHYQPDS